MQILYPKPPADSSIPQWWVFHLETNRRLHSLSMLWRLGPISIWWRKNYADSVIGDYARPSRFYVIRLNNGLAKILKLICVDCGLEFPCPANLDTDVKCDCSLARKNFVMLWWGRNKQLKFGDLLYRNSREFVLKRP